MYTVDAAYYGNISHFVNHSVGILQAGGGREEQAGPLLTLLLFFFSQCDPNLQVYNVFIDNLDERLPRIAFFATRTIWAGEELTFDYNMQGGGVKGLGAGAHSDMGHKDLSPRRFFYFIFYFFKDFLKIYFREGKGGRKRGRETSMCGCVSRIPYWGPGPKPRHVP